MAYLDVYRPAAAPADRPYLLDVQSDALAALATRVVVPLYRRQPARRDVFSILSPPVVIDGESLIASVPELAAVPHRALGRVVAHASGHRAEIAAAVDWLLTRA